MHEKKHFWLVGILTGFFSGLTVFLVQLILFHLSLSSFSIIYGLLYLIPFIAMAYASVRLRDRYGSNMLLFGQSFKLSLLTGFLSAVIMSVMIYYVYSYLFIPALQQRATQLNSELLSADPGMSFDKMKERKQLIIKLLSPLSLAIYYFVVNTVLLPFYAFIIAIFAHRRRRDITDI
jgi:uncharacterized membrane protein YhaH (DUF805 family)